MRLLLLFLAATSHALEQPRGKATAKTIRTTKADVEAVAITQALQNIKLKVTGGATTGLAHRLEVGAFFGGWYALNIYYNIINTKVLKTVGLPWLVSWAQLVVGALYALVGWGIGRTGPPAVKDAWPVAVAHCGQQVTTVISLGAGAVSMTHVVKALEPLFSAAVNAVVRGEILPLPVYAAYSDAFIVVAPTAKHAQTGLSCDIDSYATRGWCRAYRSGVWRHGWRCQSHRPPRPQSPPPCRSQCHRRRYEASTPTRRCSPISTPTFNCIKFLLHDLNLWL